MDILVITQTKHIIINESSFCDDRLYVLIHMYVWYGMVWYGMVWCGVVWCGVVRNLTAPRDKQ